jgi:hypothetical protein
MKPPRQQLHALMFASVLAFGALATNLDPAQRGAFGLSARADAHDDARMSATTVARRDCRFGLRYSSYHRKCVLWAPFG